MFRRLSAFSGLVSLVFLAWACSSDNSDAGGTDDAGTDGGGIVRPDGGGDVFGEGDGGDVDGEAGTIPATCTGNPLSGEPAFADGGFVVDADGGAVQAIASGNFLDGPRWVDDGTGGIVYSEVNFQTIVRNGPDGGARLPIRQTGAGNLPIGNAAAGGFVFTAMSTTAGTGAILRMQPDGGDPQTFTVLANSPNHVVASATKGVYFTDPGFQAVTPFPVTGVYRMQLDGGGVQQVDVFDAGPASPGARADGIALSADESTLYVAFYDTRRITKYAVAADGSVSSPQNLNFTAIDDPTGIAVDVGGNIWIAESDNDPANLRGRVEVIDPNGLKWGEIPFSDARPTAIAFGGADGKTVYVTSERQEGVGTLYSMAGRCAGVR